MPVTNYHTVNGMIIGETTNGVRRGYLPDALGSVVATVDDTGSIENTYRYKPYGSLLAKTGSGADPRFLHAGESGSRSTGLRYSEAYNRLRHLDYRNGRWTSIDPLWPSELAFIYGNQNPTTFSDPSGLRPCKPSEALECFTLCGAGGARYTGTCTATDTWLVVGTFVDVDCHCQPLLPDCRCDAKRLAQLMLQITLSCAVARKCGPYLAFPPDRKRCPAIYARIGLGLSCIYAQDALNKECFNGGNPGHKDKIKEAQKAINTCTRALRFNGCRRYPG